MLYHRTNSLVQLHHMWAKHDSKRLLLGVVLSSCSQNQKQLKSLIFAVYGERLNNHRELWCSTTRTKAHYLRVQCWQFIFRLLSEQMPILKILLKVCGKENGGILIDFWMFDFQMSHFFLPQFCGFKSEASWGWCRLRIKSSLFQAGTQVLRPDLTPWEGGVLIGYPASPQCLPSLSHRSAIFLTLPH